MIKLWYVFVRNCKHTYATNIKWLIDVHYEDLCKREPCLRLWLHRGKIVNNEYRVWSNEQNQMCPVGYTVNTNVQSMVYGLTNNSQPF